MAAPLAPRLGTMAAALLQITARRLRVGSVSTTVEKPLNSVVKPGWKERDVMKKRAAKRLRYRQPRAIGGNRQAAGERREWIPAGTEMLIRDAGNFATILPA